MRQLGYYVFALLVTGTLLAPPAKALPPETMNSVVSVLPVWPGLPQGGTGAPPGTAPEGSGVVVSADGLVATAWHVIERAERIDVRLSDGRILPARLVGHDRASDIALLRILATTTPIAPSEEPFLAQPVCAIGNAYGLGLSVSCGVVSATHVSNAGFNPVEDFVQTDAAANPGSSGGALVDSDGRLVGMVSAIFASETDNNIGINFAVSTDLLNRIVNDLKDDGKVDYVTAGWRLERLSRAELAERAAARVTALSDEGAASRAGVRVGDMVTRIGDRAIRSPRDAFSALALVRDGGSAELELYRDGTKHRVSLSFGDTEPTETVPSATTSTPDCPYPAAVCQARQAVFPIESFDPLASAVRIGPDLLVTNRHVVGDRREAVIFTPDGPRKGRVIPSAYRGDLAILKVEGLPGDGHVLKPEAPDNTGYGDGPYFAIGADVARQEIRVFKPGVLILEPAPGALLGRLHVSAVMQKGVSGGALVDSAGRLIGIAVGGGEGRYEAIPTDQVVILHSMSIESNAAAVQSELGAALVECTFVLEEAAEQPRGQPLDEAVAMEIEEACRASENHGQYLEAGRTLAFAGSFDAAIGLHQAAVDQAPHSINARISLLVSLQLGGRFPDMLPHARWLFSALPDDPQAHRFAIQAGVWGDDTDLAEAAYAKLLDADPRQAQAARRFIDSPPPAPQPR